MDSYSEPIHILLLQTQKGKKNSMPCFFCLKKLLHLVHIFKVNTKIQIMCAYKNPHFPNTLHLFF